MSIPVLNFQPYNPMDNLIQSALGVYGGINQGKQQAAQREMMQQQQALIAQQIQNAQAELPYIGKIKEAELGRIGAQTQSSLAEVARQRAIMDILRSQLNPGVNQSMGQGQMGVQAGSPEMSMSSMQGSMTEQYPGPSQQQIFARKYAGLPEMTPEEQAAVKRWEQRTALMQTREFENQFGTQGTLNDIQKQQKGISTLLPTLNELIQESPSNYWYNTPGAESAYQNKVNNAMEKLIASEGWGNTVESHHRAESMLKRQSFETEAQYKKRLKDLKKSIQDTNQVLEDFKGSSNSKSANDRSYTLDHPDVQFTAKKHGISPEQVLQRLNGER